jgi:CBS domain-containing protein
MKIKDRLEFANKPPVLTFGPHEKVINAVKIMAEKNYGASVIIDDNNKPLGIVTERDLMRRLLAKGLDANITPMSDIMTTELKLASADDNVVDWLRVMSNERFRHLPVVDENGKLLNLMSQGDFVSYTWPQLLTKIKDTAVKTFMDRFHVYILTTCIMLYIFAMIYFIKNMIK